MILNGTVVYTTFAKHHLKSIWSILPLLKKEKKTIIVVVFYQIILNMTFKIFLDLDFIVIIKILFLDIYHTE